MLTHHVGIDNQVGNAALFAHDTVSQHAVIGFLGDESVSVGVNEDSGKAR